MPEPKQEQWDTELTTCPDCGSKIYNGDQFGEGAEVIHREIYCSSQDCGFTATETFKLESTVRESN